MSLWVGEWGKLWLSYKDVTHLLCTNYFQVMPIFIWSVFFRILTYITNKSYLGSIAPKKNAFLLCEKDFWKIKRIATVRFNLTDNQRNVKMWEKDFSALNHIIITGNHNNVGATEILRIVYTHTLIYNLHKQNFVF